MFNMDLYKKAGYVDVCQRNKELTKIVRELGMTPIMTPIHGGSFEVTNWLVVAKRRRKNDTTLLMWYSIFLEVPTFSTIYS